MLSPFKPIDTKSTKTLLTGRAEFYAFNVELNKIIKTVLAEFEGKKITRRIKTAIEKELENHIVIESKIRFLWWDKDDISKNRISLNIRILSGAFIPNEDHNIVYVLTNRYTLDDRFSMENFVKDTPCVRNASRWHAEILEDIKKVDRVAKKWNKIVEMIEDIRPEMDIFPTEVYRGKNY